MGSSTMAGLHRSDECCIRHLIRMSEYRAFLIVPGPYFYRKPIRFSVLRSETNGAVGSADTDLLP